MQFRLQHVTKVIMLVYNSLWKLARCTIFKETDDQGRNQPDGHSPQPFLREPLCLSSPNCPQSPHHEIDSVVMILQKRNGWPGPLITQRIWIMRRYSQIYWFSKSIINIRALELLRPCTLALAQQRSPWENCLFPTARGTGCPVIEKSGECSCESGVSVHAFPGRNLP